MSRTPGVLAAALLALASSPAAAHVDKCDAMGLYANADYENLCKISSPTTQNLWVCVFANPPDIHMTFNKDTPLHVTVRQKGCEGHSNLDGQFPGNLRRAGGQPATVCGVNIDDYLKRLNAVQKMGAAGGKSTVVTALLAAEERGRLDKSLGQTYIDKSKDFGCN